MNKNGLTQRAPDTGESARFQAFFPGQSAKTGSLRVYAVPKQSPRPPQHR